MTLLLLWGSQSPGKPALQAGPCPSVCSAWVSLTMPVLSVQTKVASLLQSKWSIWHWEGDWTLEPLQERLGCSGCERFGLGMYVSEGRSCSLSAGSLCPWFTKLAALLWNDFLHPWKASASQLWCAGALSASDQQLGCGVYAVLCNLSFVPLWKLEPGAQEHLFRIRFFCVDDLIPFTLPQGSITDGKLPH